MARHWWIALLTVAACGLVLVATWFVNPSVAQTSKGGPLPAPGAGGRYQMLTWGAQGNPYLVLLDTHTGQAWGMLLSKGEWEDLKTPPSQPRGPAKEKPGP
jgi:hypothetical protein